MKIKLTDIKFKIGNSLIAVNDIFKICAENNLIKIEYFDDIGGREKRIKIIVPYKDVEVIVPEVQEGERGGY